MQVFKYKISMADNGAIVTDMDENYVTVTEVQSCEKNADYIKRALERITSEIADVMNNTMSAEFVVEVKVKEI